MKQISVATIVELVGVLCVLVALFAVDWRAGVAGVGVAAVAGAQLLEPEPDPGEDGEP